MFLGDQGRDALIVKKIALLQNLPAIGPPSSIGEVFLGPFYYYLMAPFLFLARFNPVGLAVGVALLSVAGIYVGYLIVKKEVSGFAALVFFLLITFSAELVRVARFSWNPNLLPYFAFITLYFFTQAIAEKNKNRIAHTLLFGLFFGLSFQLHHLAGLLALPIAVYFIFELIRKKNPSLFIVPLASLGSFLLTLAPLGVFELRHQFLNTKNLISVFTKQNIVSSGPLYARLYDINGTFIETALHIQMPGYISLLILLIVIAVAIWKLTKKYNAFVAVNILAIVLYLFGFSRVNSTLIPHYYNAIYLSLYFLIAYIVCPDKENKKNNLIIYSFIYFFIILFIALQATSYEFLWSKGQYQDANPKKVGKYIFEQMGSEKINLTTYPTDFTSRDCYQYFVELNGGKVVDGSSPEVTNTLFVICDKQPCRVIKSDSWNIQMFGEAKVDTMKMIDGIYVYKLIHK
jgi:4-amino-4-deoxy-L-arabinose transferase-like glycosyltransferase